MLTSNEIIQNIIDMFITLSIELTVLYLGISFCVGILQEYIPPTRIKNILSSKNGKGYIVAGFLGAITPFCSCSTIPFLKGLLRAQAGFGTVIVFLFSSPLLNPIVIGLLTVTFGFPVALFYFTFAMGVSIVTGYTLEKLGFERYIIIGTHSFTPNTCSQSLNTAKQWGKIWLSTWNDFVSVLPYLMVSIMIGSIIYGAVPVDFISQTTNKYSAFAIPIAAIIGIPLYIRASMVIPISAALVAKGMEMGIIMAFIIGSAGASLTEVILLKSLFKKEMIIVFLIVVLTMAISAGYSYQILEAYL
ncbi:permease [Eionea flava]